MKSILQESSTIIKAIEKAWNEAGNPEEFTIKILHKGERNFLGMCKKPSVVSFQYDSRVSVQKNQQNARWHVSKQKSLSHNSGHYPQNKGDRKAKIPHERQRNFRDIRDNGKVYTESRSTSWDGDLEWNKELQDIIETWVSEMLAIMKVRAPYTIKADQKILTIQFKRGIVQSPDEERMLFSSFSALFMQALKKKYKNKFKGFKIILHSPLSEKSSSSNGTDKEA